MPASYGCSYISILVKNCSNYNNEVHRIVAERGDSKLIKTHESE